MIGDLALAGDHQLMAGGLAWRGRLIYGVLVCETRQELQSIEDGVYIQQNLAGRVEETVRVEQAVRTAHLGQMLVRTVRLVRIAAVQVEVIEVAVQIVHLLLRVISGHFGQTSVD